MARPPVITALPARRGQPNIPFVGLAEGYALAALRRSGVPLQRIRPALDQLDAELGLEHALASNRMYTDGAEVLFDHASTSEDGGGPSLENLVVARNGQRVFTEVVATWLRRVEFGTDGIATAVPLPGFSRAQLVADVSRSFGQPIFRRGGARVEDVLALFHAERSVAAVADEFGIPHDELKDVLGAFVDWH